MTRRLQQIYFDVIRGRNPKYAHWLTPVTPQVAGRAAQKVKAS